MLGATHKRDILFSTNPLLLLAKDFLRNPIFFIERLFKTWEVEVEIASESILPIDFQSRSGEETLLWVSRQAVLEGFRPRDLDVSLELDYLRSPRKFDLMIRLIENQNGIDYELFERDKVTFAEERKTTSPSLGYRCTRNVEVVSGRIMLKSNEVLPVSNYRKEISVHGAGFINRVDNEDTCRVIRTHKTHECINQALFVGFSSSWFHFLIECVPRLISIPTVWRNGIPLILPTDAPRQIVTICEVLTSSKVIAIDLLERVHVNEIFVGEELGVIDPLEFKFRKHAIQAAISEIRSKVEVRRDNEVFEKIFLRRPKGLFRPLQNEKKILSGLSTMGFKVISPERLDFQEVLMYMTNARIVVAESGAALTNILFTLPGAKIVELYPGKGPMTFWPELAEIAGAEVRKVMSLPCPIGPKGLARDGVYIPFRKLKRTLEEWAL
jgi:hypothetical protein